MAWEKEWKAPTDASFVNESLEKAGLSKDNALWANDFKQWPAGTGSKSIKPEDAVIIGQQENKIPTHDPYTNPNALLYYECKCGKRLDPHTKSFAGLNNAASLAGWKVRWGSDGYVPYCEKCGEGVE